MFKIASGELEELATKYRLMFDCPAEWGRPPYFLFSTAEKHALEAWWPRYEMPLSVEDYELPQGLNACHRQTL